MIRCEGKPTLGGHAQAPDYTPNFGSISHHCEFDGHSRSLPHWGSRIKRAALRQDITMTRSPALALINQDLDPTYMDPAIAAAVNDAATAIRHANAARYTTGSSSHPQGRPCAGY